MPAVGPKMSLSIVLAHLVSAASTSNAIPTELDIALLALNRPDQGPSMTYLRGAFNLAAEDANKDLATIGATINLRYLNVSRNIQCGELIDDTVDLLARWHYKERRPVDPAASLVVLTG